MSFFVDHFTAYVQNYETISKDLKMQFIIRNEMKIYT